MKRTYAVVDLETTGGIPKRDKITEVAIILFDGKEIIEEYQSLINPERSIPPSITRITGIDNAMVADAPKFYEVAKKIIEMTEGAIFVAHNVRFDYQFLREEFRSLGYVFTRRNLCTVRLSRKAFPRIKSYSLGNLIRYFRIEVKNRHRAYDDALATTILLGKIFDEQANNNDVKALVDMGLQLTRLPKALKPSDIENLPEACGVYYFSDHKGFVIYIGKSINIKERAKQHFSKHNSKTDKLFQRVADISYEITGSELVSLLKESKEIKDVQPEINKIQKTKNYKYAVEQATDKSGYHYYKVSKANKANNPLSYYGARKSALSHIEQIGEQLLLCHKVNKIDRSTNTCFNYEIQKCAGACIGEEPPFEYNQRFSESLMYMNRMFEENFLVLEEGRAIEERAVFLVEDGHYRGYGYIELSDVQYGIEELKEVIKYESINPEADMILRNYIWTNENLEIIHF